MATDGFHGRVAIVTGAAGGIGRDICRQLLERGANVAMLDTNSSVSDLAAAAGDNAMGIVVDITSEASVGAAVREVVERFGRIDILVNNAGIVLRHAGGTRATVENTTLEEWNRIMCVNFTGQFLLTREVLPIMRKHRWGRIVNMASIAGRARTDMSAAVYAGSKAAMIGYSRTLAGEVGRDGITVNCVAPGRIDTPMNATSSDPAEADRQFIARVPVGRVGKPRDIASGVIFLASNEAEFITGTTLDINGGSFMT